MRRILAGAILILATAGHGRVAGAGDAPAFYTEKCRVCHSIAGDAGKMVDKGGPLDGVGAKRDEVWMRAYISDPKSKMPEAKMPKIKMTDQQLDEVVAYMLSLKTPVK
ncbi:MAG TPA: c-type cytochrome [Candidatus Binatia bacterium]|jgi:mono/diheme cytochrome c family protein